jgi:dienelactone hydrolase
LRGYLAFEENVAGPRPGVLVFHEGLELGDFAMTRARMLAELGHVALAADMFGDHRQANNLQEADRRAWASMRNLLDEAFRGDVVSG